MTNLNETNKIEFLLLIIILGTRTLYMTEGAFPYLNVKPSDRNNDNFLFPLRRSDIRITTNVD